MEGFGQFRQKTTEELKKQVEATSEKLGTSIIRPNDSSDIFETNYEILSDTYKQRYDAYLKILRAEKGSDILTQEDKEKIRVRLEALNNLDNYIENHKINEEERILRHKQFTIFEDIRNFLEKGIDSGYIKLPTGTGKTVLFSQIVEALGLKTVITVPSKILVSQTGDRLEKFTDLEFGSVYTENKDFSKQTTITTYNSLVRQTKLGNLSPKDFNLIILDEAHKALGDETKKVVNEFDDIKLGFTATPKYSNYRDVKNILPQMMHSMSVVEATREGLINRFKVIVAETTVDLSGIKIKKGDYDSIELEKAVNIPSRNIAAVKLYKEAFSGKQGIAYCSGVKHAKDLTEMFLQQGVPAAYITGETPESERNDILAAYRSGEIKVLCNARVLIEGFDEKNASVCLNLHPTRSLVDAEQRAGRVLRLDENNPDKWAYIVDFVDKHGGRQPILFSTIAESAQVISEEDDLKIKEFPRDNFDNFKDRIFNDFNNFDNLSIDGLKITLDTREVMEVTRMYEAKNAKYAPEGWMTLNEISLTVQRDAKTVSKFINTLDLGPDEKQMFLSSNDVSHEHYSPELSVKIMNHFFALIRPSEGKVEAPVGWRTAVSLQKEFNVDAETIKKYATAVGSGNPDWFVFYLTKNNSAVEHYSPELVSLIKAKYATQENKKAPSGWYTSRTLMKILQVHNQTVKNYAEKFRLDHPNWFQIFRAGPNRSEHYAPELTRIIVEGLGGDISKIDIGEPKVTVKQPEKPFVDPTEQSPDNIVEEIPLYVVENDTWLKEYTKNMSPENLLNREQEHDLIKAAQSGNIDARNELVQRNLRLASWVAKKYQFLVENNRVVSFEDLLQEADSALFKAIEKFDLSQNTKFSTYAYQWIRQGIGRFLHEHSREIRLPSYMHENISKYKKAYAMLEDKIGSYPMLDELSKASGLDTDTILTVQSMVSQKMVYIDEESMIDDGEESPWLTRITDPDQKSPEDISHETLLRGEFDTLLKANLNEREYEVLSYRFGLEGQGEHTLEEIGQVFGLSRERIRQIEEKAKKKIYDNLSSLREKKE